MTTEKKYAPHEWTGLIDRIIDENVTKFGLNSRGQINTPLWIIDLGKNPNTNKKYEEFGITPNELKEIWAETIPTLEKFQQEIDPFPDFEPSFGKGLQNNPINLTDMTREQFSSCISAAVIGSAYGGLPMFSGNFAMQTVSVFEANTDLTLNIYPQVKKGEPYTSPFTDSTLQLPQDLTIGTKTKSPTTLNSKANTIDNEKEENTDKSGFTTTKALVTLGAAGTALFAGNNKEPKGRTPNAPESSWFEHNFKTFLKVIGATITIDVGASMVSKHESYTMKGLEVIGKFTGMIANESHHNERKI